MKHCLILLTFVLVVLAAQAALANNLDEEIFYLINQKMQSPYLDTPMLVITHAGDGLTQGLLAGGLYIAGEKDTGILLTSALAKTWWTTHALKYAINRPRPGLALEDVHFVDGYAIKDNKSFPSGHTTGAFAVATVLSEQYPKYTPYFYTYATLVGVSRVYTGVHYPSDVLTGAVLGYIIGKSTVKHKNLIINGNFLVYSIMF